MGEKRRHQAGICGLVPWLESAKGEVGIPPACQWRLGNNSDAQKSRKIFQRGRAFSLYDAINNCRKLSPSRSEKRAWRAASQRDSAPIGAVKNRKVDPKNFLPAWRICGAFLYPRRSRSLKLGAFGNVVQAIRKWQPSRRTFSISRSSSALSISLQVLPFLTQIVDSAV